MKTVVVISFLLCFYHISTAQQQLQSVLLLDLTFDNGANPMVFDSAGPGTNTGKNDWVVNNVYTGLPNYPNTPNEDSTINGLIINNAPTSNYLHIHDVTNAGGTANDNWNHSNASDRFCYTASPFCTLGLDSVTISFDWICQGDSNAYGQVYYTTGNGTWIQIGRPKYYNQNKWGIEYVSDAGMNNQPNIQLGFRWVNTGTDTATNNAFGIDDIFAAGAYNPNDPNTAVTISASIYNTSICQGDPVLFSMFLSNELCDGSYEIEMSDAFGSFADPYNIGILQADQTFTGGYYNSSATNSNLSGNCFKIRVVRISPGPVIISDTSACFSITPCSVPLTIFNVMVPVLSNDPDTTCIGSEIDVYFNSDGKFSNDNQYIAELSDANGSFADSTVLGKVILRDSFPTNPPGPGDIPGLIPPSVLPGCGYRIRVRTTDPATIGYMPGTYCLVHCDELTNNTNDIHLCISSGPYAECDTVNIDINHWNQNAAYDTCNNFTLELHKMSDFSVVGYLKTFHSDTGGRYLLCMPSTIDSLGIPSGSVQAGEYYMRVISSCSSQNWNQTGTVVRVTVGAPSGTPPTVFFPDGDSVACAIDGSFAFIALSPFNSPPSVYAWNSPLLNNDSAIIWPYQEILITLNNSIAPGAYPFYVQEVNYGCSGPISAPGIFNVIGTPNGTITGSTSVCGGDTVLYQVQPLSGEGYYDWKVSPGATLLNNSGPQVNVAFDSSITGIFYITVYLLNECDSATGNIEVRMAECINSVVNLTPNDKQFEVFPNPTTGRLSIEFNEDLIKVIIYDIRGSKVWEGPAAGKNIDISGFSEGEYFLTAITADNIWKKKVILFR